MNFNCFTIIDLPRDKVVELFKNTDNLKFWQENLISHTLVSGEPLQPGTKSDIVYKSGSRSILLAETIQSNDLPDETTALFEHKHIVNTMTCRFEKIEDSKTKFSIEIRLIKAIGILPKIMTLLFPGIQKKETQKMADQFRIFAENSK